jgi:hypothetical protein
METREIKITRETAERWYNGCDKELKELALQTYPELKPKYEVGKWYSGHGFLFRCTRINGKNEPLGYGWSFTGAFCNDDDRKWYCGFGDFKEATHEEVEQRFKEEAKKRGYYDKPFVCLKLSKKCPVEAVEVLSDDMERFWLDKGCVFDNGKWAEFVKEPEYKIGERYAFADDEEDWKLGRFTVGKITGYDKDSQFKYEANGKEWFCFARKIEYKFVD